MHTYEILGHLIFQELVNLRKDFQSEIQRLGDRLEKSLNILNVSSNQTTDLQIPSPASCNNNTLAESKNLNSSNTDEDSCCNILDTESSKSFDESQIIEDEKEHPVESGIYDTDQKIAVEIEISDSPQYGIPVPVSSIDFNEQDNTLSVIPKSENVEESSFPFVLETNELPSCTTEVEKVAELNSNSENNDTFSVTNRNTCFTDFRYLNSDCIKSRKKDRPKFKQNRKFAHSNAFKKRSRYEVIRQQAISTSAKLINSQFNCNQCGLVLSSRGNLMRHMRSIHTRETLFTCDMCGKKFTRNDCLKAHLRRKHKIF